MCVVCGVVLELWRKVARKFGSSRSRTKRCSASGGWRRKRRTTSTGSTDVRICACHFVFLMVDATMRSVLCLCLVFSFLPTPKWLEGIPQLVFCRG